MSSSIFTLDEQRGIDAEQETKDRILAATLRRPTPLSNEILSAMNAEAKRLGRPLTQAECDDIMKRPPGPPRWERH
jgi:hypothetical protein